MNILNNYGLTDRFSNEAGMYPELSIARITAQYRGLYKIVSVHGEMQAEISGKLRFETTELAKFPTVGDFVMVSVDASCGNAIIHHVLTRKSVFLRTAVGVSGQAQSVAANIDTVFICMSLNNNFNLSRLERYLSVAWDSGATPVVLLTKSDLCEDLEKAVNVVERVSSFSDVIPLSVYDKNIEQTLSKYLKSGTTSAFIGSSGVGKSTLINKLLGEDVLTTADIGKADKGRHTTTGREMFSSPFGGVLIDTPGMRELGAESVDLGKTFDDIEELAGRCKFRDCTHTNEPGCAILDALANGTLDSRRFENYCKLKIEAGYDGLNAKEIEVKKLERMFKNVGGMKNMRKFAKEQHKNK
ncbi:ribosome biogenesis GTPase [Hydrogenoanaerobacterium saccharovorans]|uniref:Small ribosomal subunit biogenesis GTPase RsgA n=1 Tax=Hydrogenoanaerobacterium saccharovorans TaxID=474960 RepID=A0A1H8A130_9FIRM|nr:ribosome small subunit-dependent GTPase A [Hydrogenoanaerobacterium saccharovorans]RPF48243.1 ribosome biogenesis GTPase [Hydrogenoanaerobacterium saccharovorans]SEM64196.1 ribosome biogenesis GTPase [Hydrogenoanaerobacterium saccharovorans]